MASSSSCSLAIIGDGAVGKSSIIASFKSDGFTISTVYKQTIGFDVYEKNMKIRDDIYVTTYVWDIGGQSIHSKNLDKYLGTASAVFLVYDVTNNESFNNLDDWLNNVRKYGKNIKNIYLIGNKVDLIALRLVSEDQHNRFIRENQLSGGMFLSAKTGDNVVKTFYQIAGDAVGIKLTQAELATYDKVVKAYVQKGNDETEGRTTMADEIEAEDRAAELRKKESCRCLIS